MLTEGRFRTALKLVLVGITDSHRYSSHSFRIGAATEAGAAGAHPDDIKVSGRWKSAAYQGYIRRPHITGLSI